MDLIPGKILLIQLRQIGDVLLSTPAAEVLKANFPSAKLDFLTQRPCDQVLARNPSIDEVLVYDPAKQIRGLFGVRRRSYDLVVDLMSNPRSALITALSGARIKAGPAYTSSSWAYDIKLGLRPEQREYNPFFKIDLLRQLGLKNIFYPLPRCFPSRQDLDKAAGVIRDMGLSDRQIAALSPASRRITRRWPARHYARLAGTITKETGAAILIFWGPGEKPLAEEIARAAASPEVMVAPETPDLSALSALLRQTAVLISNCNGAKHVAQASGVPTLGIYGSSRPESWTPPEDPRHQIVRNDDRSCIACQKNECDNAFKCLEELTPDAVFAKLMKMNILGTAS